MNQRPPRGSPTGARGELRSDQMRGPFGFDNTTTRAVRYDIPRERNVGVVSVMLGWLGESRIDELISEFNFVSGTGHVTLNPSLDTGDGDFARLTDTRRIGLRRRSNSHDLLLRIRRSTGDGLSGDFAIVTTRVPPTIDFVEHPKLVVEAWCRTRDGEYPLHRR